MDSNIIAIYEIYTFTNPNFHAEIMNNMGNCDVIKPKPPVEIGFFMDFYDEEEEERKKRGRREEEERTKRGRREEEHRKKIGRR
jgi:hypothetical protein